MSSPNIELPAERLFLIDAHALCYRSYYAIRNLATSKGQATNAVYGFVLTLKKILREQKPDFLAVCFDAGKKTLRQERYAQYKIHRPSMPEDLITQIPIIKEVVRAYNLPTFEMEGFEADDIIATLTKVFKDKMEVVIVSDDKDMLQLVENGIKIYSVRKETILGAVEAQELFGIDPKYITDYIGLAGDHADNIPGVVGIGEVTARNLINEFGNLENIFSHLESIKQEKVREKLEEQHKMAVFSKELAILDDNVPIDVNVKAFKVREADTERLYELFRDLEFKKFSEELALPVNERNPLKVRKIEGKDQLEGLIVSIKKQGAFAFLIEPQDNEPTLTDPQMMMALKGGEVFAISFKTLKCLSEVFLDPKVLKITHDFKSALKVLTSEGVVFLGKIFDVMLAGYLLSPAQVSFAVEALAWVYLKASPNSKNRLAEEADYVFRLYKLLNDELKDKALLKLFEDIEIPLSRVLAKMEMEGIRLDLDLLQELSKDVDRKITDLIGKIYKLAGMEFNLNSPKQLSQVLFEKLKLPVIKKTKTGFSTDEDVLGRLARLPARGLAARRVEPRTKGHEIPALILEYRQFAKLKSTYIDALPKLVNPKTGRVHACFNQTGTQTGRLSSNDPNLQNIPIRTELGRQIRKAFVPLKKGHLIASADYSQIELRILAHLSEDKNLIKAFKEDEDIHNYTAAQIFEIKEKDVTPLMRNSAKRVNFGIIYGMSAFGLSKDLQIPQDEAQEFIDKYFLRYPDVKKFMENEIKKAERDGFVLTLLKRRRYLPEIKSPSVHLRQFAQRQAINTPVQGSAADLIKLAMINIDKQIEQKSLSSRMIITVHDELVFDVLVDEKKLMVDLIRQEMENAVKLQVPIKATIKIGDNWLDTKEQKV